MTTMTIKSFKQIRQVNEMGALVRLAPYSAAGGIAVNKAVEVGSKIKTGANTSKKYKGNPYSTPRRSTTTMKRNTAYSPVKPSAKGQREDVKLDEKMDPKDHVGPSKKNPDMYCVFDKDGKEHKLFKDKKDAEEYAVKNHDKLMGEGYSSFAQQKAVWANRKDGGKGHPDNKKKSKKEGVDEISRDDMVKKVSSTIGANVPTMLTKHDDEKKKVKTDLDRLRKALGPNHAMNKSRA